MIITKEKFDALRRIGSQMSNVCYNLSQHADCGKLDEANRALMGDLYRQWDAATRAIVPAAKVRLRG